MVCVSAMCAARGFFLKRDERFAYCALAELPPLNFGCNRRAHPIGGAAFSSAAAFASVSLRDMGKGAGKGGSLANAGDCCSEPCLKNFPGATPCGTCYWGFTPCGFLSALLFPVVGLVCCCTPDCEVCGCQCNKTVKRGDQQLARRRYLFGVIPMGSQEVHTTDRNPWYKKRLGLF